MQVCMNYITKVTLILLDSREPTEDEADAQEEAAEATLGL